MDERKQNGMAYIVEYRKNSFSYKLVMQVCTKCTVNQVGAHGCVKLLLQTGHPDSEEKCLFVSSKCSSSSDCNARVFGSQAIRVDPSVSNSPPIVCDKSKSSNSDSQTVHIVAAYNQVDNRVDVFITAKTETSQSYLSFTDTINDEVIKFNVAPNSRVSFRGITLFVLSCFYSDN